MAVINGYRPQKLFSFFEEITKIPRGSGHEEKIAAWLCEFAKERGLPCIRDEMNNVFITCPASKGYENEPPVLLQGHTDMVCEKNSDVEFDFENDPLDIYIDENGFLRARGTTLGADDGVAVATMLALLDGECAEHPALECLFTVQEETGLDGAKYFDFGKVKAKKLINLDSENDGEVIVGCAGGIFHKVTMPLARKEFVGDAVRLCISGLMGGHSGENINSGRANANKLMGRALLSLSSDCALRLAYVSGGSKDNAIPRECEAVAIVSDYGAFDLAARRVKKAIAGELFRDDSAFSMTWEKTNFELPPADKETTEHVIAFMSSVQNGVIAMSRDVQGLVGFSRNLGIVRTEGDEVTFIFSARSAVESQLDFASEELAGLALALGGKAELLGRYPGWEYAEHSALRDKFFRVYNELTGHEAKANVIHAGLECGIIKSKLGEMDIISIGPGMRDIHSPDEALDLSSFERLWHIVCLLLKK